VRRLKRTRAVSDGAAAAAHAVRSSEQGGGGASGISPRETMMFRRPSVHYGGAGEPVTPYQKARRFGQPIGAARLQADGA